MKFRIEHIFEHISIEEYERLYFDETFCVALCSEVKLQRELKSREEKDGHISRVVTVIPDRQIPPHAAKMLGGNRIEYTEHIEYDLGSYNGVWKTVSSLLTDKVDTRGTFSFSNANDGVCRVVVGEMKVKIFGVGSMIEGFIVKDIEKSYNNAATFTQSWIDANR